MSNNDLEKIIIDYREGKIDEDRIREVFYELAMNFIKTTRFDIPNKVEALDYAVDLCIDKLSKHNPSKGKAFNFFATIIACAIRQLARHKLFQARIQAPLRIKP